MRDRDVARPRAPRTTLRVGSEPDSVAARTEAERQLAAVVERHREAVSSMEQPGRPEAGQHVAVKVVARAVHLVSFALRQAADSGVPFERMVELTAWEPDLVREGLARPVPEPRVVARLAPAGVDPQAVARAAAAFEAIRRLHELTQRVLADVEVDVEVDAGPSLTPADLDDLYARLETAWGAWRQALETGESGTPRDPAKP